MNGDPDGRIPGTTNVGFEGANGQLVLIGLDLEGIAASTGAACTSGTLEPSGVLLGMGQSAKQAETAVRFSLGRETSQEDIERVLAVVPQVVERVRKA